MRFLLDTNVFREIGKTEPNPNVAVWLASVDETDLAISVLTVREVRKGIVRLRSRKPEIAARMGLAATARVHGLTLVTRNLRHLSGRGVALLDPFRRATGPRLRSKP